MTFRGDFTTVGAYLDLLGAYQDLVKAYYDLMGAYCDFLGRIIFLGIYFLWRTIFRDFRHYVQPIISHTFT